MFGTTEEQSAKDVASFHDGADREGLDAVLGRQPKYARKGRPVIRVWVSKRSASSAGRSDAHLENPTLFHHSCQRLLPGITRAIIYILTTLIIQHVGGNVEHTGKGTQVMI